MNWRHATIAVATIAPLVALLGFGLGRDPKAIPSPLPGRAAPSFALAVLPLAEDGVPAAPDTVRLETLRGQVVVLNFWASWCLACRDEHSALSAAARAYRDRGVHVYGVLYNDREANGRRWIASMGGQDYPALVDARSRTAIDYGLYGVPETFFIARDGRVAYKHIGPVTDALMAEKLDALLAEPAPGPVTRGPVATESGS